MQSLGLDLVSRGYSRFHDSAFSVRLVLDDGHLNTDAIGSTLFPANLLGTGEDFVKEERGERLE
jgi:hypothetical protein